MKELSISCSIYRGGTSRGIFFLKKDLPNNEKMQKHIFLKAIGSPNITQVDGLGGGLSHSSKIAVLSKGTGKNHINYLFGQVGINNPYVDFSGMCGNLLAAVGLYAIYNGFINYGEGDAIVQVYNENLHYYPRVYVPGEVNNLPRTLSNIEKSNNYKESEIKEDGIPLKVEFPNPIGLSTGSILPSGKSKNRIKTKFFGDVDVSIVDGINSYVFVKAKDLGINSSSILINEIESDEKLIYTLEELRGEGAVFCGYVNTREEAAEKSPTHPNICLVDVPCNNNIFSGKKYKPSVKKEADIWARRISRGKVHKSYPVSGMVTTALAAAIQDTVVSDLKRILNRKNVFKIEHTSGVVNVYVNLNSARSEVIESVIIDRTARRIAKAKVFIPV